MDRQLFLQAYQFEQQFPYEQFNPDLFTSQKLPNVFSDGQYDTVLMIESRPLAVFKTQNDFSRLKQADLIGDADTALIRKQLFNYNLQKGIVSRRYANNLGQLQRASKVVEANKPEMLKKLEAYTLMKQTDALDTKNAN